MRGEAQRSKGIYSLRLSGHLSVLCVKLFDFDLASHPIEPFASRRRIH